MKRPRRRLVALAVGLATLGVLSSCGGGKSVPISSFIPKSPEVRLLDAVKLAWVTPGTPFLGGLASLDTIGKVKPVGKRTWQVTVPDPTALGGADYWTLKITRTQVLPVDSGSAYVHWLGTQARQLDPRIFLPRDVSGLLSAGRILAVGDVQASFGKTGEFGRSTVHRVAYLEPAANQAKSKWILEPNSRSPIVLLQALHLVYDNMLKNNERVMMCMGEASATAAPYPTQRKCINKELVRRFGGSITSMIPGLPPGLSKLARQLTGGT